MFKINDQKSYYTDIFPFFKHINQHSDNTEELLDFICSYAKRSFHLKSVKFIAAKDVQPNQSDRLRYAVCEDKTIIGYFIVEKADESVRSADFKIDHLLSDFFSTVSVVVENSFLKVKERQLFSDIIDIQLKLLNARTKGGEMHSKNVQSLALKIAEEMVFLPKEMEAIKIGALLFDVGKIGIPDYILNFSEPLPSPYQEIIVKHVYYGRQIIGNFKTITEDVKDITFHHHELIDGSGYPDGLKGHQIRMIVKLITVCDVFSALIEERAYRPAIKKEEALFRMKRQAGILYDGEIINSLEKVIVYE